jgi:hypothetical protein
MTFCITKLGIKGLFVTFDINVTQHNKILFEVPVILSIVVRLIVIMPNFVLMKVTMTSIFILNVVWHNL